MNVELEKIFPMPSTPEVAWTFLQNIEGVAGCMPGAKITERTSENTYKGTVTVRVGPATMSFKGDIEVRSIEPASRTLHLIGKGMDSTGTSGASMDLSARIETTGETCQLIGKSAVAMNGKAAAFGGRMMNTVAEQILKQFAANFGAQVEALQAQQAGQSSGATVGAIQSATPAPVATELNGLALAWAIVRDWFVGLFSRKSA